MFDLFLKHELTGLSLSVFPLKISDSSYFVFNLYSWVFYQPSKSKLEIRFWTSPSGSLRPIFYIAHWPYINSMKSFITLTFQRFYLILSSRLLQLTTWIEFSQNGVRGLMLDMYDFENDIWLCHSFGGTCYNFTAFVSNWTFIDS